MIDFTQTHTWTWQPISDTQLECRVCPHACRLRPDQVGLCRVRWHDGNGIVPVPQQQLISAVPGLVERHNLYHFVPFQRTLLLGSVGCSASCSYCQNWEVALAPRHVTSWQAPQPTYQLHDIFDIAAAQRVQTLVCSISEFSIWPEMLTALADAAHARGLAVALISNGYVTPEWLAKMIHCVDAVKIDIKGFTPAQLRDVGVTWEPIAHTISTLIASHVWLECSLVVPANPAGDELVTATGEFLVGAGLTDVPLHLQRMFPAYKQSKTPPTPIEELIAHRNRLHDMGMQYVYISNVRGLVENNTSCPRCGAVVLDRAHPTSITGYCTACQYQLPGHWSFSK
jgi:pyruvate formate lyase activating enzyme